MNITLIKKQHECSTRAIYNYVHLVFNNFVFEVFKQRSEVDVVFTDFAKAFEPAIHKVVLKVLEVSGFSEHISSRG